jgi:hypothetical protein
MKVQGSFKPRHPQEIGGTSSVLATRVDWRPFHSLP